MASQLSIEIAKVVLGKQEYALVGYLSATVNADISLRDLVRLCFAELGIEIAFSGKDAHEKGVVIDMDEEHLAELGLNPDTMRFGQTVVRVNAQAEVPQIDKAQNIDELVKELMASALATLTK